MNPSLPPSSAPSRPASPGLRATLVALVLLAVLPALGLALYHGLDQRAKARDEAKAAVANRARSLAAAQAEQLAGTHRLVESLAATTVVRVIDPQGCSLLFSQLLRQWGPGMANILAVSGSGERIAEAVENAGDAFPPGRTPLGGVSFADRDWFRQAQREKACRIGPFSLTADGRPVAVVACPALGWDGEVKAVVAASLTLDALGRSFAATPGSPGETGGVVAASGGLLARFPEASPAEGPNIADTPLGRSVLRTAAGSLEATGLDGEAKLVGVARLNPQAADSPAVFVAMPLAEAYAPAQSLLFHQMAWLVVVGLVGLGAAWFCGSRLLVSPIVALVEAAEAIGRGEFATRLTTPSRIRELARLGRAFNAMAGGLMERERVLAEKTAALEHSNQDLEQFAYVASHDLQEPLRKITSFADLLAKRCAGSLDETGERYVAYMVDGARRMSQLINHLLAYSRLGTRGAAFAPMELAAALDAALDNLELPLAEAGATVTRGELPTLVADATQLTQLFQNIIGNAVKYRADRPPVIHVSARREDGGWTVAVADNGQGIAPRHFERIFRMFQRLDTAKERQGAGIGLAFCKRIVERHGGRIWVESEEGTGSTFRFTLPDLEAGPA
ncbi:MAG: ATP-binding protein [Solidesulfovibrio sp.]|uniref:sensor histidine kinase n=1 Tax=Solidesulfovibrio sp. TaxID=2910990 RepID=UPI00315905C3